MKEKEFCGCATYPDHTCIRVVCLLNIGKIRPIAYRVIT